ncbi:MAG: bifunctional 5,10-methylenetetrahydrofolate dehydrogenase/5,10-methenyltetrahydrofolate cyclohydrolase [Elusimicrobia bacterium]|nr:bifunctional 5,10-methylenetetrahydrofolate dehydrogenase/5,10-methenyltetrahydrofolate cyclohydrolase [Elusimicrobiota bacterium]
MPVLLDCRLVAREYLDWVAREKLELGFRPALATVLFAPRKNPGSLQYRDLILKDAERLDIGGLSLEAAGEGELVELLGKLNADPKVTGVMVFYPIGGRFSDEDLMDLVSPLKDVEGLHSLNLGYLIKYKRFLDETRGIKCVVPATAKAVVKTLQHFKVRLERQFVAIVNNSMRVGKPLGLMFENLGATVVECYDKTRLEDLRDCVRRADVVVSAVPDPSFAIDPKWIKPGAAVVDVSYQGNIDVAALDPNVAYATAPGNRIGQVTRAMMFVNLIYCAQNLKKGKDAESIGRGLPAGL